MNIIELKNITMRFGNIVANDNISIDIQKGEIHSLIGENGAGKSTLMSILFGMYSPTNGYIKINGEETQMKSPMHATQLGLGMVHQHFKLVGIYNAVQNIVLGREKTKAGFLDMKTPAREIAALAKKYNFNIDLKKPVQKMTVGQQQKVEILKMLYTGADILIFDEPTAVLAPKEIEGFLELLKDFKANGKTIILITHKLEEIKQVADRATIIRRGKVIKSGLSVKKTSIPQMAKLMVGTSIQEAKTDRIRLSNDRILEMKNVSLKHGSHKPILDKINFTVNKGEIVAIAGVEGNGQTEIAEVISGLTKLSKGDILFKGKSINKINIKKRSLLGISHIPEDRHKYGLVLDMPIWENVTLNTFTRKPYANFGILNNKQRKLIANNVIAKFDVRGADNGYSPARALSGGNQQKAIVGREITNPHDLLVAVQPTRGLDLGAISFIHKQILESKANGKGVLLISYELNEVLALADKVVVVNTGKVIDIFRGKSITKNAIGVAMASTNAKEIKGASKRSPKKRKAGK